MRKILPLTAATLCLALLAAMVIAAAPSKYVRINGTDYLPLADWAKANGLTWGWIQRDTTLHATRSDTKFLFVANSRETRVNNVEVWLLYPLINRSGRPFISRLDTEKTLDPLLDPPRNRAGDKIKTICLDPGHGGKDPGNRVGAQYEKDYTLRLARELRDQLTRAGFTVSLTRSTDKFIELGDRPGFASDRKADLFISLHFNATPVDRTTVKGAETYALTPGGARSTASASAGPIAVNESGNRFNSQNLLLAYEIQKKLVRQLTAADRGVRRARFAVLRDAEMPAVLIEAGFMSHPTEGRKIFNAAYRRDMAKAITDGIISYKRTVERTEQ